MILAECLIGQRLTFAGLGGRHHHPLPKHLAPTGRIEEVRTRHGQGAQMQAEAWRPDARQA